MKKILLGTCMAAFLFCLPVLPSQKVSAEVSEDAVTSGEWTYEEQTDYESDSGYATLVKTTASGTTLEIPDKINNLPVKEIGGYSGGLEAPNAAGFTKIVIPDSVTEINEDAFKGFTGVKEVVLPDNPELYIWDGAFTDCAALESVTIADIRNLYYEERWNQNAPIKTITVKGSAENVDLEWVADMFKKAQTVNLPAGAKTFAAPGFSNLSAVNSSNLSELKFGSLKDCANLHIAVNADLTEWGSISDYSGSGITSLTIDGTKFNTLYEDKLLNCTSLQSIVIQGENEDYVTKDGVLYSKYTTTGKLCLETYPIAKSTAGDYTFDENVMRVTATAFDGCKFTSYTIPENVTGWSWDLIFKEAADGSTYATGTFLTTTGAKLRLVKGSFADEDSLELLAKEAMIPESQIEYYLGNTYQISYNLAGGVNAPGNPSSYRAGEVLTLADPTYSGYTFLGWVRSDGTVYENTTVMKECFQNYTFTATWINKQTGTVIDPTDKNAYTLKYNANGGKGTMVDAQCRYGTSYVVAANKFTRKGYTFRGWSARNSGGAWLTNAGWQASSANRKILSNRYALKLDSSAGNTVTLYAEWTKVEKPAAVKKVKLSNKSAKKMNVSFGKVQGAAGYEIQYATSKKFKGKKSVLATSTKKTISKMKNQKTYYVRVRAYKKDSTGAKVWGKYSKVVSIKIKK